jgi:hypothetical protein
LTAGPGTSQDCSTSGEPRKAGKAATGADKKPRTSKRKQKTSLPEDWTLPDEWREAAKEIASDNLIDRETPRFKRYWLSPDAVKERLKADWPGTWINWIERAVESADKLRGMNGSRSHEKAWL